MRSSEQGQKRREGCGGHKHCEEESILSLLDKGMLLKAEGFVVDVFEPTERISLQEDYSDSRFI